MARSFRWSRTALAAFIMGGTAAFGVGALAALASPAAAARQPDLAATQCGLTSCPGGVINSVDMTATGAQIVVSWTPDSGAGDNIDTMNQKPSITVTWFPTPTTPPPGAPQPSSATAAVTGSCVPSSGQGKTVCTFAWPADMLTNGYVLNGTYQITAAAVQCGLTVLCGTPATTATWTQPVALPAKPPTNVTAALAPNQADTVITWDPSPEPDVLGYRLLRGGKPTGFQCRTPANGPDPNIAPCPAKLSATDVHPGGGQYTYQVVAYRYGATYAKTVDSSSAASKPVTVPGPPSVATTTIKGGGAISTAGGLPAFGAFSTQTTPRPGTGGGTFTPNIAPSPAINTPGTPDPGFQPTLPYGTTSPTSAAKNDPAVVGQKTPVAKTKGSVGSIALIGAGLLVAVVAFHGLWLRSEVRRAGALEVLEPET